MPGKTRSHYEAKFGKGLTSDFYTYVKELEGYIAEQGWLLTKKQFNTYWCALWFSQSEAAFGVGMKNPDLVFIYIKDVQGESKGFLPSHIIEYDPDNNQAVYSLEPGKSRTADFAPLLKLAYERRKA